MKLLVLFLLLAASLYNPSKTQMATSTQKDKTPAHRSDTIDFVTQVKPIFVTHCSPCHFPGGKMYEKLPFDKPETILAHEAGILRRIKDEKDNALIKQYIHQRQLK